MVLLEGVGLSRIANEARIVSRFGHRFLEMSVHLAQHRSERIAHVRRDGGLGSKVSGRPDRTDRLPRSWRYAGLAEEDLVQFLSGLLAAGIVTVVLCLTVAPYWGRVGLAALMGALGVFTVSTIYWNWYGFTNAFLLAQVVDMIVGWALAGAVIARLVPAQ